MLFIIKMKTVFL